MTIEQNTARFNDALAHIGRYGTPPPDMADMASLVVQLPGLDPKPVGELTVADLRTAAVAGRIEAEAQLVADMERVRIIREQDWPDGTCSTCGEPVPAIGPMVDHDDDTLNVVYEHCGESWFTTICQMPGDDL